MEMFVGDRIPCKMFSLPLPSNDRFYSFHYSGIQPSCHSIIIIIIIIIIKLKT
jgi:hypothetical protein